MTEEEAKTKTCPHHTAGTLVAVAIAKAGTDIDKNGINSLMGACMCSASDCVVWFWDKKVFKQELNEGRGGFLCEEGHCGLVK